RGSQWSPAVRKHGHSRVQLHANNFRPCPVVARGPVAELLFTAGPPVPLTPLPTPHGMPLPPRRALVLCLIIAAVAAPPPSMPRTRVPHPPQASSPAPYSYHPHRSPPTP